MKNPKVSVIIPVYNGEKTLGQCLSSVLSQSYKDYEVIVVDNNSTDKTKEITKGFQKKDRRIIYLFEKERKRGAARNTGEKKAGGDMILMTDSDCIVPRDWVEKMVKELKNHDAVQGFEESVSGDFWSKYRQFNSEKKYEKENIKNPIGKIDTKNLAVKKEVLAKLGFTSRKYFSGNDTYLSIKLAKNKCKVRFAKNIKVKHFHPNSLRKVFRKQMYRAKWTVVITKDYKGFLKKSGFLEETNQTPYTFFIFFPGIFATLIKKGFKYTFYDFVTGISWRIGLIEGWLNLRRVS